MNSCVCGARTWGYSDRWSFPVTPTLRSRPWIGIDGVDATGKTTCIEILRADVNFKEKWCPLIFDEFTYSPVGEAIRRVISEHRFLSLTNPPTSRWADTFLLLSDWSLKLEQASASEQKSFFSDRSHLSIIGYQVARIRQQYGDSISEISLVLLREMAAAIRQSIKGLTFTDVLLLINPEELRRRVMVRGEPPLTNSEVDFLMKTQSLMESLSPQYVIDVSASPIEETMSHIYDIVECRRTSVE
jgi:thymidylate kinase